MILLGPLHHENFFELDVGDETILNKSTQSALSTDTKIFNFDSWKFVKVSIWKYLGSYWSMHADDICIYHSYIQNYHVRWEVRYSQDSVYDLKAKWFVDREFFPDTFVDYLDSFLSHNCKMGHIQTILTTQWIQHQSRDWKCSFSVT